MNILTENNENINKQDELYDINEKSVLDYGEKDLVQQELAETLRKAKLELKNEESLNILAENNENINKQGRLDQIEKLGEEQAKVESKKIQGNSELLKKSKLELIKGHNNEMYEESKKYRDSKSSINKETKLSGEINEKADEAHVKKVAYVATVGDKTRAQNVEAHKEDKEARMIAEKEIHDNYEKVSEKTIEEGEISKQNTTAMTDLDKIEQANRSAENIGQKNKHYDDQSSLSKVSDASKKKPIVKNSIGSEYPEGVSQESFTRSDNNGLVTTIITRRIVVIEGHADIYIRTQSMHGITYSKNGKPSLSNVWSRGTQGPHLERHF